MQKKVFSLWSKLGCEKIKIVDVGAMDIGERKHQSLIDQDACEIIGFEPDEKECEKLNLRHKGTYFPYIIGNGSPGTFYTCNFSMNNSLYEPNIELLEKFQRLAELIVVTKTESVSTMRLDDIEAIKGCDFLKMDIQGGEMQAFLGAEKLLKNVLVVQAEVMFLEMYKGQPLFTEICQFLWCHGFQFHRFASKSNIANGRCFKPLSTGGNLTGPISQCIWGDVVYVKDFMRFGRLEPVQLLKIAAILHDLYNSWDFAHYVLMQHDKQTGKKTAKMYQEMIEKDKN